MPHFGEKFLPLMGRRVVSGGEPACVDGRGLWLQHNIESESKTSPRRVIVLDSFWVCSYNP